MGYDRITSSDHAGVIPALIEHSHIQVQYVSQVDCTFGSTLVRADSHHVLTVDLQVVKTAQQAFDKLIGRAYCFKACLLYTSRCV